MSRYDGLIIPRSYSEYINKTDSATLLQALQLSGVMDAAPTQNSNKPVKSGGLYTEFAGVKGRIATLEELITANTPRMTPKNITAYVTDGTLWQRLAGTNGFKLFENLHVGDYIQMSRPISAYERSGTHTVIGSQYVTIAGIDTLMYKGDQGAGINYHHLVMVPGQGFGGTQHFGVSRMNPTDTTEGGYKATEMNTATLGAVTSVGSTAATASINEQLYAEFGAHLMTTRELITNSINASAINKFGTAGGCSNSWEWASMQAVLMSEVECYGATIWSSSGFDSGNANKQLPLFFWSVSARNNRSAWYWLKDIASAALFCYSRSDGEATYNGASTSYFYVRPRFVIA